MSLQCLVVTCNPKGKQSLSMAHCNGSSLNEQNVLPHHKSDVTKYFPSSVDRGGNFFHSSLFVPLFFLRARHLVPNLKLEVASA